MCTGTPTRRRSPTRPVVGVPGVVEHAWLVGDVEHRRDAVLDERTPRRGRGSGARAASRRRAPARSSRAARRPATSAASWASSQSRSRSVTCATGCTAPAPSCTTVAHQRFHAPMLREQRGERRADPSLPEEPEVREAHRRVEPHRPDAARRVRDGLPEVVRERLVVRLSAHGSPAPHAGPGARRSRRSRPGPARRRCRGAGRAT